MHPSSSLSILVATYNRPHLLAGQLAYLANANTAAKVIVLDSSDDPKAAASNEQAAHLRGFSYSKFSSGVRVFAKVAEGISTVTTPYCVMLADDDILCASELDALVGYLDSHPDHAAVHGLYAEFHAERRSVHVRKLEYSAANLAQALAMDRIQYLLSDYEALTYSVQRTEMARTAFGEAARQPSILGQELLHSAMIAALGKVARLSVITHGRRAGSSMGYRRAHPIEWVAVEPWGLFETYPFYRQALLKVLEPNGPTDDGDGIEIRRRLDLAHLSYLARYLDPVVLSALASARPSGLDDDGLARHAWETLADLGGPKWLRPLRSRRLGPLRDWWRRRGVRYALQSRIGGMSHEISISSSLIDATQVDAFTVHLAKNFSVEVASARGSPLLSAELSALAQEFGYHEQCYLSVTSRPT